MEGELYVFERFVNQSSYNSNFVLHEKRYPSSKWVGKISKPLAPWADFRDLDDRALLAFRLSKLAKIDIPESKLVDIENILGLDSLDTIEKINNKVFLTKYSGINLKEYLKTHKPKDIPNFIKLYDFLVFNLWVGNYDKKTEDYLIDEKGDLMTIDYQLLGPGFTESLDASMGGWLTRYYLDNPTHTGWCFEGAIKDQKTPLISYVRKTKPGIKFFKKQIAIIKNITKEEIISTMRGLKFYGQFREEINDVFLSYLISRQDKLEKSINVWINEIYPNEIDQQQLHQKRKSEYFKNNKN